MLQKQKQIIIEGNSYNIEFPNVGQYLDIENMKMMLTNNTYSALLQSRLRTAYFAIDLVDAISVMYILIPGLRKDLNVKDYNELDTFMAKKIVKVYQEQIKPWYDELMNDLLDLDPINEINQDREQDQEDGDEEQFFNA